MSKTLTQSANTHCISKIMVFVTLIYPIIYLNTFVQGLLKMSRNCSILLLLLLKSLCCEAAEYNIIFILNLHS